jgi:hypothetical protein
MARKKTSEMTEKELLAEIEANEEKRNDLFKQKEPIDRNLVRLARRNEKLQDVIAKMRAAKFEKSGRIDWEWLLHTDHRENSMDKYHLRQKTLRDIGLMDSGYFPETEQTCIRVALIKNDPESLKKHMAGLRKVLKYIKPLEDGWKRIDIFESSLSRHGSYFLVVSPDGKKAEIKRTVYSRTETLQKFNSLKAAIEVIQDRYYYEDAKREERDYDDDW